MQFPARPVAAPYRGGWSFVGRDDPARRFTITFSACPVVTPYPVFFGKDGFYETYYQPIVGLLPSSHPYPRGRGEFFLRPPLQRFDLPSKAVSE